MAETPRWKSIESAFAKGGLSDVFVGELNWNPGVTGTQKFAFAGHSFNVSTAAELKGFKVIEVAGSAIPSVKEQKALDKELSKSAPERILVFTDGQRTLWRWPRHNNAGNTSYETLDISAKSLPSYLSQRIVGLRFEAQDFKSGLSLGAVRDRVRGKFDASPVTKTFFKKFQEQHLSLATKISGLNNEDEKSSYATLMLNRLMLLYFLQKKEFLNSDPFYLETCLSKVKSLQGTDKFFSFYRQFLLPMFFERLASSSGGTIAPEIEAIIGDIPYINGGIYAPHSIEIENRNAINIPDEVFVDIFAFFSAFNWHLDTRPSGNPNEVNPDVIGYIFEQYINFTSSGKKDNGAYYTKEDVTGYMVSQTLVPKLLDVLVELGLDPFALLEEDPTRYIPASLQHGFDALNNSWLPAPAALEACWAGPPENWAELDNATHDPSIQLSDESWVETFYRRERLVNLISSIEAGAHSTVNGVITANLDGQSLLTDAIDQIANDKILLACWKRISEISIIDPTCGSGAFLFAALTVLEDTYAHILDVMSGDDFAHHCEDVLSKSASHPNRRYFIRKYAALSNLYGTDLMPDAIETAKLRIFLALASCLETRSEIEPLPDLDFNLKCGNLVLGLKDADDVNRFGGDLLVQMQLLELAPEIDKHQELFREFVKASNDNTSEVAALKEQIKTSTKSVAQKCDLLFADLIGIADEDFEAWQQSNRPFHWFCEFPDVIENGGFDVIVGNPPYIRKTNLSAQAAATFNNFRTSNCPDVYAVCFERSLQLLHAEGRHAFIVMLSLSFGNTFAELRQLISEMKCSEWWSTYGIFPAALFSGAAVRNTILILGPGDRSNSTRHHIFTAKSRANLFETLQYFDSARENNSPPLRGGIANAILDSANSSPQAEAAKSGEFIYVKPVATYWFPVLPVAVKAYDISLNVVSDPDARIKAVPLSIGEPKHQVVAALAGKISFFLWSAHGDNFDVAPKDTLASRKLLAGVAQHARAKMDKSARELWSAIPEAVALMNHKGLFVNIKWRKLSTITDAFDRELLDQIGLGNQWRNLNIWYRQSMRSSGDSSKEKAVSAEVAKSLLDVPELE